MAYYHFYTNFNEGYDCTETDSIAFFQGYPSLAQIAKLLEYRGMPDKKLNILHSTGNITSDGVDYFIEEITMVNGEQQ